MSDQDNEKREMPTVIVSELPENTTLTSEVNVTEVTEENAKPEEFNGEQITPEQQEAQESAIRKALREHGIADRYKVKTDEELAIEMAKTIANGDKEIQHLQRNLDQITPLAQRALQQYQQPSVQPRQAPAGETEELRQAREFVENIQNQQLDSRLAPLTQQLQAVQTDNWILTKAMSDPEFAEAYKTGALARQFQALTMQGAPYSPQAVEFAYLQLRDSQLPNKIAAAQTAIASKTDKQVRDKATAFVEGGGRPTRDTRGKAEILLEKAGNLTSDQILAEMRKLGITTE